MQTTLASTSFTRRGTALLAALALLIVAFALTINMIDQGSADVRSQALRESDVRSYADAMSAANYVLDYLVTNATTTTLPTSPTANQVINLASITYGASATTSPFTLSTTHKTNYYNVPVINSSKLAWVKVSALAASQPYYEVSVDSEGKSQSQSNTIIALGSDVDESMLRGVDAVLTVTNPPPVPATETGIAMAVNADTTFSYKAYVDWWQSGWNGTNTGTADPYDPFKSPNPKAYTGALVQAFSAIPTTFGNGGNVNSSPSFSQSTTKVPQFTYSAPSSSFGNITTSGVSIPGMNSSGELTGAVTLVPGQSYHFSSIASTATITIDAGTGAAAAPNTTAQVYVDGAMGLGNNISYAQNNTVLEIYSGDPGSGFSYSGNSATGVVNAPGRFIWATSANESITMNGNGTFGGVFIAPNATMKLTGTFNFYGALEVGAISQISGNFGLAYDSMLSTQQYLLPTSTSSTSVAVNMSMWRTR